MQRAIDETERRRALQEEYNRRARHHARDDPQEHPRRHRGRGRRPRPGQRRRRPRGRGPVHHRGVPDRAGSRNDGRRRRPGVRAGRRPARPHRTDALFAGPHGRPKSTPAKRRAAIGADGTAKAAGCRGPSGDRPTPANKWAKTKGETPQRVPPLSCRRIRSTITSSRPVEWWPAGAAASGVLGASFFLFAADRRYAEAQQQGQ